ncbi:MAG: sensor histidine kinase [Saprospiraceae bacterium]|nr:sensor histidine kinase [Saprospiraceae bacterium]
MFKNLTIRAVALLTSVVILLLVLILYFIHLWLPASGGMLWIMTIVLLISAYLLIYMVMMFFLDKFIYRKIKVIYKVIHKSKVSTGKKIDSDENIIQNVEREVAEWAEDQQRQIDTLRALETYRRDYVGNISHELKTPIFNIQGYLHTLLEGGLQDENINLKYLERAAVNVDRLQNIVQDLDTISKLESGQMILDITAFDIRLLVQEVLEHLEMQAAKKQINIGFKEGADKSFKVKADRETIRQVFINLISNAIKYGNPGGYVRVSFYDMHNYILVEIADNGIGIPEKHLAHLFDRFYRVEKSRSRAEGGTGLGLSIVKHIIEAHKQTINVRSTPGLGSTFGFTMEKA